MKIQRAGMMSPTGKAVIVDPVFPNAGVQMWYQAQLDALIAEMYHDSRAVIIPAAEDTPAIIATDEHMRSAGLEPNAAGVVFRDKLRRVLLLRRTDYGRRWAFPGGGIEYGESPEEAARRECLEELNHNVNAYGYKFAYLHTQYHRATRFATFLTDDLTPFVPRLNDEHSDYLWIRPDEALGTLNLHPGVRSTLEDIAETGLAQDATPTKELQRAMQRWGDKWIAKFDLMSNRLSLDFAARNQRATETAVQSAFKKAGFTVAFKPTRASVAAYQAVAAEQVGLIRSIAQKYHTDVQTQVWESVKRGADLHTLSEKLANSYNITRRRAALIARDQNAKAKATIEAVRHQQLGIKQAIWMHSHAGKEPRPTHVKMNRKLYDLARGMWDSDEQAFVHPGQLINCRCTMRPYIPGFEAPMPEWDIVQT